MSSSSGDKAEPLETFFSGKRAKFVEGPLIRPGSIEPRAYQQAIAKKACQKNTLVVLSTALGKTIISALTAAYFLYSYREARILVMAPTRPLVLQHRETYMNVLTLAEEDSIVLTGKMPPEYRKHVWEGKSRVIFATPQVIKNDLESGTLSLRRFSLIIFDECHRARKEYAYIDVAKRYAEQAPWPIILGMTASPGSDKDRIGEICQALFIEQIVFKSEDDPDVASYTNPIAVEWKQVDLPEDYLQISRKIRTMLNERLDRLYKLRLIYRRPEYATRKDLLVAGEALRQRLQRASKEERGPIYGAIIVQSASLTLFHALELLETQGLQTLVRFLEKLESEEKKSYATILNDPRYVEVKRLIEQCKNCEHPKVELLRSEIESQLKLHPRSKILAFTQYRDTASYLTERLRSDGKLRVERFVGQASKGDDPGLSQDEQAEMIRNFRDGDTNVLVATCIAEEGLDIPSVDLVIFYEPIPSEIRYIQRKGRTGRKAAGKVVILAARGTFDIAYLFASKRRLEMMRRITRTLNAELSPMERRGTRPEPDPVNVDETKALDGIVTSKPTEPSKGEEYATEEFLSDVDKACR